MKWAFQNSSEENGTWVYRRVPILTVQKLFIYSTSHTHRLQKKKLGLADDITLTRFNAMPDIVQKTIMNTREEIINELGLSLEKILKDNSSNKIMPLEDFEKVINSLTSEQLEKIGNPIERSLEEMVTRPNGISVDTYTAYTEILERARTGRKSEGLAGRKMRIRQLQVPLFPKTRRININQ